MTSGSDEVIATLQELVRAMPDDTPWALVGGLAVSTRSQPRFTRDVGLAVDVPDDQAAEAVTAYFGESGWAISAFVEQGQVGRLAQVRLRSPRPTGMTGDLLFASSGIESEIAASAEVLEIISGLEVPVAQVGHLIALKLLSVDDRRHQDPMDLAGLATVASPDDWRQAQNAVALITERGFHRDRDLASALDALHYG